MKKWILVGSLLAVTVIAGLSLRVLKKQPEAPQAVEEKPDVEKVSMTLEAKKAKRRMSLTEAARAEAKAAPAVRLENSGEPVEYIYVDGKRVKKEKRPESALMYLEQPDDGSAPPPGFNPFQPPPGPNAPSSDASASDFGASGGGRGLASSGPGSDSSSQPAVGMAEAGLEESVGALYAEDGFPDGVGNDGEVNGPMEPDEFDYSLDDLLESRGDYLAKDMIQGVRQARDQHHPEALNMAIITASVCGDIGGEETVPWLKKELKNSLTLDPSMKYTLAIANALDKLDVYEGLHALDEYAEYLDLDAEYSKNFPNEIAEMRALAVPKDEE